MRIELWTASRVVAACLALGALTACDPGSDAETETDSPAATATDSPSASTGSGHATESDDALNDLAASASEAFDSPPLLRIRNQTSAVVVLTGAEDQGTATIAPGKSLQLMSERVCGWLPLTATTEDGQVLEEYDEPCRGQTWTIAQP